MDSIFLAKRMSARNLLQLWYCKQVILSLYSSTNFKLDGTEMLGFSCMLFIPQSMCIISVKFKYPFKTVIILCYGLKIK